MLETAELAALLQGAAAGLARPAVSAIAAASDDIEARRVAARTDSTGSQWLARLIDAGPELLAPEARGHFDGVEIYAVDSSHPNAFARIVTERRQIIVFDGLRHLVHHFADFVTVLGLLLRHRGSATIEDGEGGSHSEALMFSSACVAVLADFVATNRLPPGLHDLLGPRARRNVEIGYRTALLFVLLHEVGHIRLGHLSGGPLSEASHVALLEPEALTLHQTDELAADAFAIDQIAPAYRAALISSLMFLMGGHALLEAFYGGLSEAHPLAINRLARLAELSGLDEKTRTFVGSWMDDRVRAFRSLAADRKMAGGHLGGRIATVMPIDRAHAIITEVRRRVIAEQGNLEAAEPDPV